MVAVELNANSFTGGKNRVTSDKLRDMLMDKHLTKTQSTTRILHTSISSMRRLSQIANL